MKRFINLVCIVTILMMLLVSVSLCNQDDTKKMYSIATAGSSGTYYLIGGAIANILNEKDIMSVTAEATAGAGENLMLLDENKVEFAIISADQIDLAYRGEEPFTKSYDIRVICPLYPNVFQIIVPADSDIQTIADLEGKRVSVGAPGSGIEITNKKRLESLGISYEQIKPEFLTLSDNAAAMSSGNIDAALVETSAPTSFAIEYQSKRPIRLISLSQDQINMIMEANPAIVPITIPPKTYSTFNKPTEAVATYAFLVAREDISEEIVYKLVRAIDENIDDLKNVHAAAKMIDPRNIAVSPIPIHPGAERYFKEIGIIK